MAKYRVSQGELWHRVYEVEADSMEEAQEKYEKDAREGLLPEEIAAPEYVEDIIEDQEWWEEV